MDGVSSELVVNLLSNSPFVAFLVYMYIQQRKDLHEQRETQRKDSHEQREELKLIQKEARSEMAQLRKESKEEEEKLRERYQIVISDLGKEKMEIKESLERRIQSLEKSIRKIFSILEEMKAMKQAVNQLQIKDQIRELK
jgi:flagellar motility protein MotE (MotC chaperone)